MKLTILETGEVPHEVIGTYGTYAEMFRRMFADAGAGFDLDVVSIHAGAEFPDPAGLERVLIPGSSSGVYDSHAWLDPLRAFIRSAYRTGLPMAGICFGHQIIADALGGDVGKSEKGWGLGRHSYRVLDRPGFMSGVADVVQVTCSHQDQVKVPPAAAQTILASDFTPHAGLYYDGGHVLSFQPHPEIEDEYARYLIERRRDRISGEVHSLALASLARASDRLVMARVIADFFQDQH